MNATINLLIHIMYFLVGDRLYKVLKNVPDKKDLFINLAKTFDEICKKSNNEDILVGDDRVKQYYFIKSTILDLMNQCYVVLNDSFVDLAVVHSTQRLATVNFDSSLINDYYNKVYTVEEVKDTSKLDSGKLLTAVEWNSLWNLIVTNSNKPVTLESINKKALLLGQLPGAMIKTKSERSYIDFGNTNEFPEEFVFALNWSEDHKLSALNPVSTKVDKTWVQKEKLDIQGYLFNDFRKAN